MNQCHCGAPATWLVRVVEREPVVELGGLQSIDTWASCDEHLAESARLVSERQTWRKDRWFLQLRAET